jgi:hypothetical protein
MPSPADQLSSRKSRAREFADGFKVWNRKLHYYLGLYFLFFLWLFAFSGLLLNHGAWSFAQFFPNRKVTNFECAVQPPTPASDLDQARDLMRQFGIQGEISWNAARTDPARLDFNVSRPGHVYQIQAYLQQGRAKVAHTEYNAWGVLRTLHTFVGVSLGDPRNQRDWVLTTVWAYSMDAVAAGVIFMVLSSFYMWWGLREKRKLGLAALGLGTAVCGLFVFGLCWIYTA